mgnify:CR=1 FL=1
MFNKPTPAGTPGVDVYAGCNIDYSGTDVTPETFVKVLTGDQTANGKVRAHASLLRRRRPPYPLRLSFCLLVQPR